MFFKIVHLGTLTLTIDVVGGGVIGLGGAVVC